MYRCYKTLNEGDRRRGGSTTNTERKYQQNERKNWGWGYNHPNYTKLDLKRMDAITHMSQVSNKTEDEKETRRGENKSRMNEGA